MQRILVAVDGYEPSLAAAQKSVELAMKYNAELICLQVEEKTPMLQVEKDMESITSLGLISSDPLKLIEEYASNMGIAVQSIKTTGLVTATILQTARHLKVDLIVIGDSARKRMDKLHFGSVAESVLRGAPAPVLVIKRGTVDITALKELAVSLNNKSIPLVKEATGTDKGEMLQKAWGQNFLISFSFFAIFTLYYFTTAAINSTTLQHVATHLMLGIPLGLWMGFAIFPFALTLCFLYLRIGR